MIHSRKVSPSNEWGVIIKAQDEQARKQQLSIIEAKNSKKKQYKQALDEQLQIKLLKSKEEKELISEELSFYQKQQQAIKLLETQKKNHNRLIQKQLLESNQSHLSIKQKLESLSQAQERKQEQELLKQAQKDIEDNLQKEKIRRDALIQNQKSDLTQKSKEKQAQARLKSLEKETEKLQIQETISKMRLNEGSYKQKFEKAKKDSEDKQKLTSLTPTNDYKDQLISRRAEEWQKKTAERENNSLVNQEKIKKQKINELQHALDSQIYAKDAKRIQESLIEREYYELATESAKAESINFKSDRLKKLQQQAELKQVYDQQVKEKFLNLNDELSMSPQEKKLHKEILSNLQLNRPVSFVSIPGYCVNSTPVRRRVVRNDNGRADRSLNYGPCSYTPPPFVEVESLSSKRIRNVHPDPFRHNPITNPIGADIGIREQRNSKGVGSILSLAGSIYVNQNYN